MPSRPTSAPVLPVTDSKPREAPTRNVAPGPSVPSRSNRSMSQGGAENSAPPTVSARPSDSGASAGGLGGPAPSAASAFVAPPDELSTLLETPESPQIRALPGLGKTPGAIASAKAQILRTRDGVNTLIPLALKYPNRIVTPFRRPEVVEDGLEVFIKGNSVYVRLDDANPRGVLYIYDADAPSGSVIQLTVVGRSIPPQTVITQLDRAVDVKETNEENDYVGNLRSLMRTLLRGGVPQGYSEEHLSVPLAVAGDALAITPEKRFTGSSFEILRYSIRNVSQTEVTLSEEMFGEARVRAVAFYPLVALRPDETTQVTLVVRSPSITDVDEVR